MHSQFCFLRVNRPDYAEIPAFPVRRRTPPRLERGEDGNLGILLRGVVLLEQLRVGHTIAAAAAMVILLHSFTQVVLLRGDRPE